MLSVPPLSPIRAELLDAERDLVLLDGRETPFRCGLKYVLWFDVALRTFPTAAYVAAGDDDAYIQLSHLEADLRLVHAQAGAAPTLYGLFQWRSHYDNVTLDTSTGFMGWLFDDSRAMAVRRSMEACRDEVRDAPARSRRIGSWHLDTSRVSESRDPAPGHKEKESCLHQRTFRHRLTIVD